MMNPDLSKARSAELHRQARSARLGEHAHRARGGGGLLELRVGLAYVLVKWGLALLRPERAEVLDGRDAERLLEDAA